METTTAQISLNTTTTAYPHILNQIRDSYIWIVFFLGFPGNVFCLITIKQMHIITPATFFVAALAACDGFTLLVKLVGHQMTSHQVYIGTAGCKARFVPIFSAALANWVLVLICLERFISVRFPLKKVFMITKMRSYISFIVLSIIILFIFSTPFILFREALDNGYQCGIEEKYFYFWTKQWHWISLSFTLFVPFFFIALFTALIIITLRRSRQERRHILRKGSGNEDNNKKILIESERLERTVTIMLIMAALVFLIMSTPSCVYFIMFSEASRIKDMDSFRLFKQIQFVCIDSTHAVNFFLYFFSAKRFRDQFLFLITCKRYKRQGHKGRPNEITSSHTYVTKYSLAKSSEDVRMI